MSEYTWILSYQTFGAWYVCGQEFRDYSEAAEHASYLRSFGIVTATKIEPAR